MRLISLGFPLNLVRAGLGVFTMGTVSASLVPSVHLLDHPAGGNIRLSLKVPHVDSQLRLEVVWPGAEPGSREGVAVVLAPEDNKRRIRIQTHEQEGTSKKWSPSRTETLVLWPEEGPRQAAAVGNVPPRSIQTETLSCLVRYSSQELQIWIQGRLILVTPFRISAESHLSVEATAGALVTAEQEKGAWDRHRFVPAELSHLLPSTSRFSLVEMDGIPFEVPTPKGEALDLSPAGWPEAGTDPSFTSEGYDGGTYFVADPRLPLTQIPQADYVAAYLLARAAPDKDKGNVVTLRIGRRMPGSRHSSQVLMFDFPTDVPRSEGSAFQVIRIPLTTTAAPWIEDGVMDVEITKEIRLARRSPDPNRFRWRPLGLPSGVEVAGLTFERSPLQMTFTSAATGSLFASASPPAFTLTLENIVAQEQAYEMDFLVNGKSTLTIMGKVPAGEKISRKIELPALNPGYYDLEVSLRRTGEDSPLISQQTSFGVLPPDRREHRASAPWGTWDFSGMHFSPNDEQLVGEVMHKLGLRYGMFNSSPETREKFGVIKGDLYRVRAREENQKENPEDIPKKYEELKKKHPDLMPEMYIFHEDSISGSHVTRIPDLFHDRPSYKLNEEEQTRFDAMWRIAEESAKAMRKAHPGVKIHLGNGPVPLREEFYRNKFPSELFDTGGNENASFARIPESQPPDPVANNSGLWMDRQLLDHYGYGDKDVYQAHETIYPGSNPGNLSYQTQADYLVRNVLHSMAWKMPRIRPGIIADVGNSYYHSNWGSSGLMHRRPRITPKPAAMAMAGLSLMLDGAKYEGFEETGSESVYVLRFRRPDGSTVLPFWTVRGQRDLAITVQGTGHPVLADPFGHETTLPLEDGTVRLTASSSPQYLQLPAGLSLSAVQTGLPSHSGSEPSGKRVDLTPLDSLEGWNILSERDSVLEFYNPMSPRRKGDFLFRAAGPGRGIEVTPRPIKHGKETMPMYGGLESRGGIPLPGQPSEIGLWVEGNSGWGRILFELVDASGQRWTSIGAKAKANAVWMADWLGEELAGKYEPGEISDWNTDDGWGLSRINFDGWRYVGFPLPGQYPGEKYHWAANSQWRSDGDGIVHYPLTLKKILIELPEKVLYLTRYAPPKNPRIAIRDLVVVEDNRNEPKAVPGDYDDRVQITVH